MNIIILAAGAGYRLRPLTKKKTKSMLKEFDKKSLLEICLNCLSAYSNMIKEVVIVGGHGFDYLKKEIKSQSYNFKIKFIINKKYVAYNTCYSLYIALGKVTREDIIIINADVLFDPQLLDKIMKETDTALIVDNVKRLTQESMKVIIESGKIVKIDKNLDKKKSYGEYIGIARINRKNISLLKKSLREIIINNPRQYYDYAFQMMSDTVKFNIINTNDLLWSDMDDFKDLKRCKKIYKLLNQNE